MLSFCFWICLLKVVSALPQGIHIGRDGTVGASWGGYSASAGLGGLLSGAGTRGGLHAQAGTPDGHFASAGLGGSVGGAGPQGVLYSGAGKLTPVAVAQPTVVAQPVAPAVVAQPVAPAVVAQPAAPSYGVHNSQATATATASASASASASGSGGQGGVVGVPVVNRRPQGSFFDDIFNIPISTLGAVNQYLNNKNRVAVVPSVVAVQQPQYVQGSQSSTKAVASSSAQASSSASASAGSSAGNGGVGVIDNNIYHGYQTKPNYNDIFNIPISVLGAVNRFLNGK